MIRLLRCSSAAHTHACALVAAAAFPRRLAFAASRAAPMSSAPAAAAKTPTTGPVDTRDLMGVGPEALTKIGVRDTELRAAYDAMPESYSEHALPPAGSSAVPFSHEQAYLKRLIYRSKQRGWLEVDLLLGSWAVKHLPSFTLQQLQQYERILNMETVVLFSVLQGAAPIPPAFAGDAILESIIAYSASNPLGMASPAGYKAVKGSMSN